MSDYISENRIVKLVSNQGAIFEIERKAIKRAGTIETLINDLGLDEADAEDQSIPLPLVKSVTLKQVVDFCNHHANSPLFTGNEDEFNKMITDWDKQFLNMDHTLLYDLMLAANYLDIKCLLKAISRNIAEMIKGKSVTEMRDVFNIENDYTPEEEEQLKRENAWCEIP